MNFFLFSSQLDFPALILAKIRNLVLLAHGLLMGRQLNVMHALLDIIAHLRQTLLWLVLLEHIRRPARFLARNVPLAHHVALQARFQFFALRVHTALSEVASVFPVQQDFNVRIHQLPLWLV